MKNEIKKSEEQLNESVLLDYLKTLNNHLTDVETNQFLQISKGFGLNPFKREIYASKYGGNFSIVVGYETYIKRAERSGLLDGWKVTTSGSFNQAAPRSSDLKAIITIFRSDFKHPFEHEVEFAEYCQFTKEGHVTKFWKEKPITMIKKVAISQGFRLCFSDELGGLPYTKEEIGQEEIQFTTVSSEPLKKSAEPLSVQVLKEEPKINEEAVLQNALKIISLNVTIDALTKTWNSFTALKTNQKFIDAVKKRRVEIESKVQEEQPESTIETVQEEESSSEMKAPKIEKEFETKDFSNSCLVKDAIAKIKEFETIEEVEEFVTFESRESVIQAKEKRIEFLTFKTNENV